MAKDEHPQDQADGPWQAIFTEGSCETIPAIKNIGIFLHIWLSGYTAY